MIQDAQWAVSKWRGCAPRPKGYRMGPHSQTDAWASWEDGNSSSSLGRAQGWGKALTPINYQE